MRAFNEQLDHNIFATVDQEFDLLTVVSGVPSSTTGWTRVL